MPAPRRDQIAELIRQRLVSGAHFGTIPAGSRLPSARSIAGELDADVRVVTAAYDQLVREGLVERRPGSRGYFAARVTRGGAGTLAPTAEWLVEVLAQARARGVPAPHFPEHARRALESRRLRAVCLECNQDQIDWLCRELHEDFGVESSPLDIGVPLPDPLPPELRQADLLVTTASHVAALRPLADRLGVPLVIVAFRADITSELLRLLGAGPVYYVGVDPRWADKLRHLYAGTGIPLAHVRPVILDRDDVSAIPAGAPAFVMRTARERLGGVPSHVRALPTLRLFSEQSARELLSIVVRANMAVGA